MSQPSFDLQTALSAMADYPALLRRLGVIRVIEVDLAGSGIDPAAIGPVTVSATPAWTTKLPASQVHVAPVTVPAHLAPTRFTLMPDRRVDPAEAGLGVAEVDTDSAAIRLVDLARQVVNAEVANATPTYEDLPPVKLPEQLSLPSLRNAGLSLFQGDRAVDLRSRLVDGRSLLTAQGAHELTDARAAVKGLLVDVWDDRTRRWHTLCARRGTYQLPGGLSFTLDDEGAVSLAVSSRTDSGPAAMMYLHQSILRWTGWSLVAPAPGQPVITETEGSEPQPGTPALPGFSVTFAPQPRTLPVLRFGRGYRFQLRMVDVAGHADPLVATSTDFSRAVPGPASPPARYLRFQPVIAPVLVPTTPMSEGESVETLVIRPEPGLSGLLSTILAPVLGTPPVRHVAPPKVGEVLCEEHGMVDTPSGVPDPARYSMLATRDKADLTGVGTPDPRFPRQRYVASSALSVTWLPDPLSRGAAIAGLPGGTVKVRFDPALLHSWPDVRSFRLQVVDGDRAPLWDPLLRLLTLYVPRGETRRTRLSSFVDDGDLNVLGHLGWLVDSGAPAAAVAAAKADMAAGRAWQVTPYRSLTLVNAVKVPVEAPALVAIAPAGAPPRTLGSTTQELSATAGVHRPSTGQLALVATASEPVDDPADPGGPRTVIVTASPAVAPVGGPRGGMLSVDYDPDPVSGSKVPFGATHVLGDTRRHQVTYSLVATTRYMEHFVQRGAVTLTGTTPVRVSSKGIVPGSDVVRTTDGATAYRRDVDYVVDEAAGTVARTATGAIPSGSKAEVAIVAPPVTRTSAGGITLDLPSTARPDPAKVAWIVPTFGWAENATSFGLQRARTRSGGGLRIFLERPWYSSGVGEQLAVVLGDGPVNPDDGVLVSLLTQLGADPVVTTEKPGQFPAAARFPLAKERRAGLVPPELVGRGGAVAIAAHSVEWDAERQRWSCDVVLPAGRVYQPFVRLAVARYQPNSLGGVELSAVSPVEWVQLNPDRTATVVLDSLDLTKVSVTVAGRSGGGTDARKGVPNTVSVIVQTSSSSSPGDLDWTTVGSTGGQVLAATLQADGTTTWTGTLRLPKARLLAPFRLVITEHEQYTGGGRLVYSDTVRL